MPWKDEDTFETEEWHYIKAVNDSGPRSGPVQGAVIHSGETPEGEDSAIGMGNWFANSRSRGSTHAGVDGGVREPSTVQYVYDSLVAWGAGGANHSHLHVEIAGKAGQTSTQWHDEYSERAMDRAANVVAQWAIKYGFPLRWVTVNELRRGVKGLCTHADVRDAFGKTDHWDPGPNFPKGHFLNLCEKWYRYWMQQHPSANGNEAEPDFKVVVLYGGTDSVDEGMARVYGKREQLKVLPWPSGGVTFKSAFAVGAAARHVDDIEQYIESNGFDAKVVPLAGENRDETAEIVREALGRRFHSWPGVDY